MELQPCDKIHISQYRKEGSYKHRNKFLFPQMTGKSFTFWTVIRVPKIPPLNEAGDCFLIGGTGTEISVTHFKGLYLMWLVLCVGVVSSKSFENFTPSAFSSNSSTAALSHFSSRWALCIIFSVTFSSDVCSSNRSWTTSSRFCRRVA